MMWQYERRPLCPDPCRVSPSHAQHCSSQKGFVNGKQTAFIQRFSNHWPLKALYIIAQHSPIHSHVHTPTVESTTQGDSQLTGAVRVRRLAQGHLVTQLGGAGDQTSNLPVTSQPALPPEPQADRM